MKRNLRKEIENYVKLVQKDQKNMGMSNEWARKTIAIEAARLSSVMVAGIIGEDEDEFPAWLNKLGDEDRAREISLGTVKVTRNIFREEQRSRKKRWFKE